MAKGKRVARGDRGGDEDPIYNRKRVAALTTALIEKGVISHDQLGKSLEAVEQTMHPLAAKAVVKAWRDPAFKALLLRDATKAFAQLGVDWSPARIIAVENTEAERHLIVCTLCSCYHRGILRVPPKWYKGLEYRSRAVNDPRGVLEEFGVKVGPTTRIQVHDASAEVDYFVIPRAPSGFQRNGEHELEKLVTPEAIIGVEDPKLPA